MRQLPIIIAAFFLLSSCSSAPKEQPFTVDQRSTRCNAGAITAYLKTDSSPGGSLRLIDINVFYYPVDDAVCLMFKTPRYTDNRQFWSKIGRAAFISAFEIYTEEYEQHQLVVNKNRAMRETYGIVRGYYVWQRTKITIQAHGRPRILIGYQFAGDSVFFTATQMEARYTDPQTEKRNQISVPIALFFTRAQAESLINLFNQEYLQGLCPGDSGLDRY